MNTVLLIIACCIGSIIISPILFWPFKFLHEWASFVVIGEYWFPKYYTINDFVNNAHKDMWYETYAFYRWIPIFNIINILLWDILFTAHFIFSLILIILRILVHYCFIPLWTYFLSYIFKYTLKINRWIYTTFKLYKFTEFYNWCVNKFMHIRLG